MPQIKCKPQTRGISMTLRFGSCTKFIPRAKKDSFASPCLKPSVCNLIWILIVCVEEDYLKCFAKLSFLRTMLLLPIENLSQVVKLERSKLSTVQKGLPSRTTLVVRLLNRLSDSFFLIQVCSIICNKLNQSMWLHFFLLKPVHENNHFESLKEVGNFIFKAHIGKKNYNVGM